jgi:N-acetylglutamate synthase-like GNAT family acetyltransferase
MTLQASVVSAFAAGRGRDAAALVFEYMAATLAETGRAVPAGIGELPAVLERECRNLPFIYRAPGALLIADHGGQLCGCVGLACCSQDGTAEIRRLYVRPDWRDNGIAGTLMRHAHHHAGQHGMTRLILDVLPVRTRVIDFYRQLGYTETEPFATESPSPMIYMERPVTSDDILSSHRS